MIYTIDLKKGGSKLLLLYVGGSQQRAGSQIWFAYLIVAQPRLQLNKAEADLALFSLDPATHIE